MGKHKAVKMTKAERENYEAFHGNPANPKLRIRSLRDLIMLPFLIPMVLPLIGYTVLMSVFTALDVVSAPFRRK